MNTVDLVQIWDEGGKHNEKKMKPGEWFFEKRKVNMLYYSSWLVSEVTYFHVIPLKNIAQNQICYSFPKHLNHNTTLIDPRVTKIHLHSYIWRLNRFLLFSISAKMKVPYTGKYVGPLTSIILEFNCSKEHHDKNTVVTREAF